MTLTSDRVVPAPVTAYGRFWRTVLRRCPYLRRRTELLVERVNGGPGFGKLHHWIETGEWS